MRIFIYLSAFATAVGFFYSWRSPRRMLYLIFYFSLIEGTYINYFYPRQAPLVLKDMLVFWTYGLLIAQGQLRTAVRRLGSAALPMGLFGGIYILHVFNPELNSLLVGAVGLRVAIFYIPLALVALVAFQTEDQLWRFMRFCVWLTIPVCLYGIYQYFGGGAHIAALGPGYVKRGVALLYGGGTAGHTFRTLATFTYSSSFSMFILLMVPLVWVSVGAQLQRRWREIALVCVLLLFAAQISSGGRQALIFTAMAMMLTELFEKRRMLPRIGAPIVVGLGLALGFFIFGQEKISRYETILDVEQVKWRYETYFVNNNLLALENSPLGNGSGSASAAARHVASASKLFTQTETAFSKLAYEVGIPGLVAYLWMLLSVIFGARRALRSVTAPRLRLYGRGFMGIAIMTFLTSFNGWPLDVPPANALFWVFAGAALLLPHLQDRLWQDALAAASPPPVAQPEPGVDPTAGAPAPTRA